MVAYRIQLGLEIKIMFLLTVYSRLGPFDYLEDVYVETENRTGIDSTAV